MKPIWVVVLVLIAFGAGYGLHQYRFGQRQHPLDTDDDADDHEDDDDDELTSPSPEAAPRVEIVERTQIQREVGYLYFLRGADVWRTPLKRAGKQSPDDGPALVALGHFTREDGYLYYLDRNGDVARVKRAIR
jgi:hypothetical protein